MSISPTQQGLLGPQIFQGDPNVWPGYGGKLLNFKPATL